jgi:hypothetical protein
LEASNADLALPNGRQRVVRPVEQPNKLLAKLRKSEKQKKKKAT